MTARGEVLVVDDDATFRVVVVEALKAEGCTVLEATNGREALRLLRTHQPNLILTDLAMPTMNGWELCDALGRSKRLACIPVAVLSGTRGIPPRATRQLHKPVAIADLVALVDSVLPEKTLAH
ncbi:MAG: response regulator [Polyangiaceae bacterium]|jgi:CheY-like chemotaxis protein